MSDEVIPKRCRVSLKLTVTGEQEYGAAEEFLEEDIALTDVDIPDHLIMRLAHVIQKGRRKTLWGICEEDDCDKPCVKNSKVCEGHQAMRRMRARADAAQYPTAF